MKKISKRNTLDFKLSKSLILEGGSKVPYGLTKFSNQSYGSDSAYDNETSANFQVNHGVMATQVFDQMCKMILAFCFGRRLKISLLLIIVHFAFLNVQGQNQISDYYRMINKADICIIDSQYIDAINLYNQAFKRVQPSDFSIGNYIHILSKNEYLKNKYKDTLFNILNQYCINKENNINRDLNIKVKLKCTEKSTHDKCDSLNKLILSFAEKDRTVRNNAIASGIAQNDMYKVEPSKSMIRKVDSVNYFDLIHLLTQNQNGCIANILNQHALMDHMLKIDFAVKNTQLDTLLISLAMKNILNRNFVASFLQSSYNHSILHKPKEEYNFEQDIYMTDHFLNFPILDSDRVAKLDEMRNQFGLSSLKDHIRKTIWQREHIKTGFRFVFLAIYSSKSYEEELETMKSNNAYFKDKKFSNYKFNEPDIDIFK